jgi:hypothetical protein
MTREISPMIREISPYGDVTAQVLELVGTLQTPEGSVRFLWQRPLG